MHRADQRLSSYGHKYGYSIIAIKRSGMVFPLRGSPGDYKELGTTHGMRTWKMSPEQLDPTAEAPPNEDRKIVIRTWAANRITWSAPCDCCSTVFCVSNMKGC